MKKVLAWALPLACTLGVHAQPGEQAAAQAFPPAVVAGDAASIAGELAGDGTVRVIVELALPAAAASLPHEQALAEHGKAVRSTQERVLNRVFGGTAQASQASGFDRGLRLFEISPMFAITVNGTELNRLAQDPDVQRIHLDRLSQPLLQNSVPLIGMDGANGAYARGATGQGQAVAVLDTGVQVSHPFLSGKTIAQACFSNASGGGISLCPNGTKSQVGPGAAEATTGACLDASDNLCTHGTHVAGAAVGKNPAPGLPPSGVAKEASLVAVQVFTRFNAASDCGGADNTPCLKSFLSDELAALEWVFANRGHLAGGAQLASVNMSLGGGAYDTACDDNPLKPIIDSLRTARVATVIASGNNAYIHSVNQPGCISSAVTVGATTLDDKIAQFSNESQTLVDLLAPGVDIYSSVPVSRYDWYSGTSMATPHVAGAFAAIRSRLPDLSVTQIETALESTGVPIPSYSGTYSTPRIAASAALDALGLARWTLTVGKSGSGTVTSSPAGIDCGSACSARYDNDIRVTLTQTAAEGYRFSGWGGACAGTGVCSVTMNAERTVSATFVPQQTLTVTKTGQGRVTGSPAGIDCGSDCSTRYDNDTRVTLTQTAAEGYRFSGWGGACTGTDACTVVMDAQKAVSASFEALPRYPLTVTRPTSGVVGSDPAGILCGGKNRQCTAAFSYVRLMATPNAGYTLVRWVGCPNPVGNTCHFTLTAKTTVKPVFGKLPRYSLRIAKNPLGSILGSPAGLKCPDRQKTCTAKFFKGTDVTLTPVPQPGRTFAGWSGDCSGTAPCNLQMDGNKRVVALFR